MKNLSIIRNKCVYSHFLQNMPTNNQFLSLIISIVLHVQEVFLFWTRWFVPSIFNIKQVFFSQQRPNIIVLSSNQCHWHKAGKKLSMMKKSSHTPVIYNDNLPYQSSSAAKAATFIKWVENNSTRENKSLVIALSIS